LIIIRNIPNPKITYYAFHHGRMNRRLKISTCFIISSIVMTSLIGLISKLSCSSMIIFKIMIVIIIRNTVFIRLLPILPRSKSFSKFSRIFSHTLNILVTGCIFGIGNNPCICLLSCSYGESIAINSSNDGSLSCNLKGDCGSCPYATAASLKLFHASRCAKGCTCLAPN